MPMIVINAESAQYSKPCAHTLGHPDPAFVHQHFVDALAAQLRWSASTCMSSGKAQHVHMLARRRTTSPFG
jgi:hypothetical protein